MKNLLLLLCILILVSCYTDNNDFDDITTETQLLRSIYVDDALTTNFEYFPDGKIKAQINILNGAIYGLTTFEYANDTVYKKTSGFFSAKSESYLSNSNTITFLEYGSNDNLLYTYLNSYASSNCGLSKTEAYTQYNQLYTVTEYDYLDDNCSYNSNKSLANGTLKSNYSILKDDKHNYKKSINSWPNFEQKHNVIEYRQWNQNNDLVLANSYNSVFVYDENGYPIQETKTMLSGEIKVYSYDYY